ncbi:MAG TPA: magnesium transporter [Halieaceae bacterium]|jgi:magnesium transporter|uniref:magnesium transporter n=1 Tax=Haliea TaxID=475794 RepID=UPI0003FE5E4C|nr:MULTISPECIES: magnesium transporter [Haliea]MAL04275.1 magnesium transporter [Arenimonas sp.]HAN68176.1 magnesium transporter [Halieaceae bacterium]MAY93818.1 magnesium transporter [Haliea sp.]MBK41577.1 magnesium transporter [Haliea sp.]MBP70840.1 magnesium transporter [Haliea sp.]|tara:strand:- start:23334 stop:24683 length:1350 start_codon:yes stop_codon:yes gene_type:complete
MAQPSSSQARLERLSQALGSGTFADVKRMLNGLPAADVAHLLESSPPKFRHILWQMVELENEGDVINELGDELRAHFLSDMDAAEVAQITEHLQDDDLADILQQLPDRVTREVLDSMDQRDRTRLEQVMNYPDDTAGGLMSTDTITIRPPLTLDVVLRYLRRHNEIPAMTDNLIVVNRNDQFIGLLPLNTLLVSDPSATVREMMLTDVPPIPAAMPDDEVARLFERNDWVSAPVVDDDGRLLGRITIDDVVDVIREDADHSLTSMAGLAEDTDTFAPVLNTASRRAIWLGINLLTAFIAASVINVFQETIEKVVALAVLMPIVASMGGIAGTQTLTVMVRGIALGQVSKNNESWLIHREVGAGILNGLLWAAVVAVAASAWFQDWTLGLIIALAIIINLVTAAFTGAALPLLLKRLKIDPALAGGVVLTTVTDVVGFFSFLGLATWFYA